MLAGQTPTPFWTVDTAPMVRIGAADGTPAYVFGYIGSVSRAASGSIVVMDDASRTLRVFDAQGRYVVSYGRSGQGPGEFGAEAVHARFLSTDTIATFGSSGHLQYFSVRRGYLASSRVLPADLAKRMGEAAARPRRVLLGRGGYLVIVDDGARAGTREGVVVRSPTRLVWAPLDLGSFRPLGSFPGTERVTIPMSTGPFTASPVFAAALVYGSDPAGERVCAGDTMKPRIDCFDRGIATLTVTWPHQPVDIPKEATDQWKARMLEMPGTGPRITATGAGRRMLSSISLKTTMPAYSAVFVDTEKNVWIGMPANRAASDSGRVYSVYNPAGLPLGKVAMPRMTLKEIHADVVVGVTTDEDDVQRVVIHRIRKR
jgi:hypothetical protein